jgi:hypothetical protein
MSKCSYCLTVGHKITTCVDPSIRDRVTRVESTLTYRSLGEYLEWCSTSGLSVLCSYYKLGISGTIKEKREKIAKHWIETHQEAARITAPEELYRKVFPVRNDRVIPIQSSVQTPVQAPPAQVQVPARAVVQSPSVLFTPDMISDMLTDLSGVVEDEEEESAIMQVARQMIANGRTSGSPPPSTSTANANGTPLSIQLPSELSSSVQAAPSPQPRTPIGPPPSRPNVVPSAPTNRSTVSYTMTHLSDVSRLIEREDSYLEAILREETKTKKAIGSDGYMELRSALQELDNGPPEQYEIRLSRFRGKKEEVLRRIRTRTESSRIGYAIAMLEYNRMIRAYPLFVSVPTISPGNSSSVAAPPPPTRFTPPPLMTDRGVAAPPPQSSSSRSSVGALSLPESSVHQIRSNLRPVGERRVPLATLMDSEASELLSSGTAVHLQTVIHPASSLQSRVATMTSVRRSTIPGKTHLRALRIDYGLDPSLNKVLVADIASTENVDECTLCCETYTNAGAPKVMFNCSHNTCIPCVVKMAESRSKHEIQCPFCREQIKICYLGNSSAVNKLSSQLNKL